MLSGELAPSEGSVRLEPEGALGAYPGALALVTHDDAFAESVTARTLRVTGGAVPRQ